MRNSKIKHPDWALQYKTPGTELKLINGRYYLYGVRSVYDKTIKRSRKISLGILGSITQEKGFVPSEKQQLKIKSEKSHFSNEVFSCEYGFSKWLLTVLEEDGILDDLKKYFPSLWHFIIMMVFCRTAHKSPLKNIPFYLEISDLPNLLSYNEKMYDRKISDLLFELGCEQKSIHEFMKPKDKSRKTVLIDATDIVLQSAHIPLAQKGYNSDMNFQRQFVLLYLYDANNLKPLYYRLLPGNIREISAMP